jgi:hypothetical protein
VLVHEPADNDACVTRKSLNNTRLAQFIAAVLDDEGQAQFWAEVCAWLPGSGRCQTQGRQCGSDCPFRVMRESEARRISAERRRRRAVQKRSR